MCVSDYLGSQKCCLHRPSTPIVYPSVVLGHPCRLQPNNPSALVRATTRNREIDAVLDSFSGRHYMHQWCLDNGLRFRFERRLARRFLKAMAHRRPPIRYISEGVDPRDS